MDAVVGDFGLAAKIPKKRCDRLINFEVSSQQSKSSYNFFCSKTRLDTVGSPYWMSPECLKGQWYDETSDVFSFGIILCEIIARVTDCQLTTCFTKCTNKHWFFPFQIEADPDILPRTDSFGLDYLSFVDLCPNDTPPVFLRLAFYCCTVSISIEIAFNFIASVMQI